MQHQAGTGNWASPGVHTLTQWYKPVEFSWRFFWKLINVAKKVQNNFNQNLPRILKDAENRKSCPKSQKLPESCRATCGWAYCLDSFMMNNSFQRYPFTDFRSKIQTHVNVNLWLLIIFKLTRRKCKKMYHETRAQPCVFHPFLVVK